MHPQETKKNISLLKELADRIAIASLGNPDIYCDAMKIGTILLEMELDNNRVISDFEHHFPQLTC